MELQLMQKKHFTKSDTALVKENSGNSGKKITANTIFSKLNAFPLISWTRWGCLHPLLLFNLLMSLGRVISHEKYIKDTQIRKGELKLYSCTDDIILYVENPPNNPPKPLLELTNEFRKVAEYKINTLKECFVSLCSK